MRLNVVRIFRNVPGHVAQFRLWRVELDQSAGIEIALFQVFAVCFTMKTAKTRQTAKSICNLFDLACTASC